MKTVRIVASLLLVAASASAQADAIKCRGPDGKVFITDTVCPGNNRVDRVQRAETISLDRQIQAARVHSQNSSQLNGIQAEQNAWQEQQRRTAVAASRPVSRHPTYEPMPSITPEPERPYTPPKQAEKLSPVSTSLIRGLRTTLVSEPTEEMNEAARKPTIRPVE